MTGWVVNNGLDGISSKCFSTEIGSHRPRTLLSSPVIPADMLDSEEMETRRSGFSSLISLMVWWLLFVSEALFLDPYTVVLLTSSICLNCNPNCQLCLYFHSISIHNVNINVIL